jgi:S1-C subfamily serine protease
VLSGAPSALAQDWAPAVAKAAPGVLRLEAVGQDGSGICSVVVIDKDRGFAVTCAHCVPFGAGASLAVAKRDVEIMRLNRALDLAVIRIAKLHKLADVVNVPVRSTDAPIGTPIAILGYALGAPTFKAQFGYVAEAVSPLVAGDALLDAQAFPGDSGGAVIDASGALVSVTAAVVGQLFSPNAYAVGVNAEAVRIFLEDYLPLAGTK